MLGFLFRTLTPDIHRGAALFDAVTKLAREPHWYVEGKVPDTIDGRFAVLSTIAALLLVRLEEAGEDGAPLSVAFTERFIEVMESEHRELGLGDPTLGKTVRKLVGSLARRTELWRSAASGEADRDEAVRQSLYRDVATSEAVLHSGNALDALRKRFQRAGINAIAEGRFE